MTPFHRPSPKTFALGAILAALALAPAAPAQMILLEAEGFEQLGGWTIDQQFMDQMGSPFLLAHGLGRPVEDAIAKINIPEKGRWRLWARTRDWVAPWKAPGAPGKFQVLINDEPLKTVFGTQGPEWAWQDGGAVELPKGEIGIALHDLTGFDGRCDALVLSRDADFTPPHELNALNAFRRAQLKLSEHPDDAALDKGLDRFDLVVVGGGIAGTCTAVSAARLGLNVALVQNRPVLGGNNSSEVRVHLQGKINLPPYPKLGNVVHELDSGKSGNAMPASNYDDGRKLGVAEAEETLHLYLNTHANKVEMENGRIAAVVGRHIRTNRELRFEAPLFADCTGDGAVGFLAGADFRMGRESFYETGESLAPDVADKLTMGTSVQWYSEATESPSPFPECPWALQFTETSSHPLTKGEWNWETGLNRNQITEFEYIRDYGLRAAFGNWAYIKNKHKNKAKFAKRELAWMAHIGGKRESRRLLGDVILQEQDVVEQRPFPDAFVTTTWTIDLHYPHPNNTKFFPDAEFRTVAKHQRIKPYPIPYRCLYSRNIPNLMMAGRNISVTHVALGTIRVQRTTGMMGELLGMAASLCKKHHVTPRVVYHNHLTELKELARRGVGKDDLKP